MALVSAHTGADKPVAINPNIRALIVDDEAHVRVFLRTLLQNLGLTDVHEACDGQQAIEAYQKLQPTVVLMDINMPVMNGHEAVRQLMALDPEAAIIMMTSVHALDAVKEFRAAGVMGYITKQTPPLQLRRGIQELLACFEEEAAEGAA